MSWQIKFLGVGNGGDLGTSAAALLYAGEPNLLIDCGPGTLPQYLDSFGQLPPAVFITHLHFDHIGDLEALFYKACFAELQTPVRVFIAAHLVPHLTLRVGNYPGQLAEGGTNFWDVLQLVPVIDGFWWQQHYFRIYPTRHHQPNTSFALHLAGRFFFSGDTRPIPEIIHHFCSHGELLFHDCCLEGNPSHSSAEELLREYNRGVLQRLYAYHYHSAQQALAIEALGIRLARRGAVMDLPAAGNDGAEYRRSTQTAHFVQALP